MTKKLTVFFIAALMVIGMSAQGAEAGDALAEETIDVRVNVPVMQQMEVKEAAVVEYDFSESEEAVIVENAGAVEVESNADWRLNLDNFATSEVDVLVRRSGESEADWRRVDGINGGFQGTNGSEEIEVDVKVRPAGSTQAEAEGRVELGFTLEQI